MRLILLLTILVLYSHKILSDEINVSFGISVSGYKLPFAALSYKVKDINYEIDCTYISWGTKVFGSGWQLANNYIVLYTSCSYSNWRLDIYTNNTLANTGYQKGGLISITDNTQRIPVGWMMSGSTITISNVGEPGELVRNIIKGSTSTYNMPWRYLKDRNDQDDPDTNLNESWDYAFNNGYTTVCFGGGDKMYLSCGLETESPIYVYFEALMNYVIFNQKYITNIYFDLIPY